MSEDECGHNYPPPGPCHCRNHQQDEECLCPEPWGSPVHPECPQHGEPAETRRRVQRYKRYEAALCSKGTDLTVLEFSPAAVNAVMAEADKDNREILDELDEAEAKIKGVRRLIQYTLMLSPDDEKALLDVLNGEVTPPS